MIFLLTETFCSMTLSLGHDVYLFPNTSMDNSFPSRTKERTGDHTVGPLSSGRQGVSLSYWLSRPPSNLRTLIVSTSIHGGEGVWVSLVSRQPSAPVSSDPHVPWDVLPIRKISHLLTHSDRGGPNGKHDSSCELSRNKGLRRHK